MAQQDKKTPEYRPSKAFTEYKKWYKSLEGGSGSSEHTSSSENAKLSRTKPVALPSERARALLKSRRSRKIRFELMPGDKPADPTQQHHKERLQPILKHVTPPRHGEQGTALHAASHRLNQLPYWDIISGKGFKTWNYIASVSATRPAIYGRFCLEGDEERVDESAVL
ncbi:hypothetical protein PENSUB_9521 [Penicillium subrubescens]|uniref:Uncharacterized protein n=1 Tax=Penicillium subrubescens TaxID=1316194 RepID=A0A1Q5TD27_9EURO|nr:hypothetical protein PENSUB_9521 [Penicillium subrubescens]